jgi:hypothetical protein
MANPNEVREVIFKALKDYNAEVSSTANGDTAITFRLFGTAMITERELQEADPAHLISVLCTRLNKIGDEATKASKYLWSLYDGEKKCLKKS